MSDRAPGPDGHILVGSLPEFRRDPIQFFTELRERHGDVSRFELVGTPCYLIAHPDHVKRVLQDKSRNYRKSFFFEKLRSLMGNGLIPMSEEDAFWRQRRRVSQPPFHPKRLAVFAETMVDSTERMLKRWEDYASSGETVDLADEMMEVSMHVACKTLFDIDVGEGYPEIRAAFTTVLDHVLHRVQALVDLPEWIPTGENRRFHRAKRKLDEMIYEKIKERREGSAERTDLLALLIKSSDEDPESQVDDRQLLEEAVTFFAAGFETSASTLGWTLYLLLEHPDYMERVQREVDEVLGGHSPAYADLERLDCTRKALEESMRLYPPVYWFTRAANEADEIAGCEIPKDAVIVLSTWVTHRHPAVWDEPERFDPERFTPENTAKQHPAAHFPFGVGPRSCLGSGFAMMQMQIAIAMALQRYSLELLPEPKVEPKAGITLRPKHGIPVKVRRRDAPVRHAPGGP